MRDGQPVSWVGSVGPGQPAVGDTGSVISSSGDSGHVMWATGSLRGQVTLVEDADVVEPKRPTRRTAVQVAMEDSLEVGHHIAARETFEESGPTGLLNVMASAGYLSGLGSIAEAAADLVAARLREEPTFSAVLATLEPTEADALVSTASMVLLRDAFSPEDV
jgi:hypothetical protein